jgi:hypothetical protein
LRIFKNCNSKSNCYKKRESLNEIPFGKNE